MPFKGQVVALCDRIDHDILAKVVHDILVELLRIETVEPAYNVADSPCQLFRRIGLHHCPVITGDVGFGPSAARYNCREAYAHGLNDGHTERFGQA